MPPVLRPRGSMPSIPALPRLPAPRRRLWSVGARITRPRIPLRGFPVPGRKLNECGLHRQRPVRLAVLLHPHPRLAPRKVSQLVLWRSYGLCDDGGVLGSHAEGDDRADVAEDAVADVLIELRDVLVAMQSERRRLRASERIFGAVREQKF